VWDIHGFFVDVILARKSVRVYADKPVEEEKLSRVLEVARLAQATLGKVFENNFYPANAIVYFYSC
jgi:hypothetical protein